MDLNDAAARGDRPLKDNGVPGARTGERDTAAAAPRVVAHVDLDAFFASVEQLLRPELRGEPVVVGGRPNQRGVVAAASYEARARGVRVPMPLTRAYRICPEAHFLPGRHALYQDYSRRVFAVVETFSPQIEQASIDEGYLDWTVEQWRALHAGQAPPRHWPVALAERLRDAVMAQVGLSVSVGVGSNRLIAKIASAQCKPRGLCHVATGSEAAFLRPMPLSAAPGIGARASELLAGSGLFTVADVQDMPWDLLVARVGESWAERLGQLAAGEGRRTLTPQEAPKSVSNERTFRVDCRDPEAVRAALYRLVEKAAWRLRRAGLKAGTVTVKLRTADFRTRTHGHSLGYRSDCQAELYLCSSRLLEGLLPAEGAVRLVGVQLSNLDEASERQLLLFGEKPNATGARVDRVLDAVRERIGFFSICTAGSLRQQAGD